MTSTTLSVLPAIADRYERVMREVEGEYVYRRWGASEVQRRHRRQTERALGHALRQRGDPGDVLEIGCGPVVWTPLFLPAARRVLLYDLSEAMLIKARERRPMRAAFDFCVESYLVTGRAGRDGA
jgi:ubiquinone/menaquinone biosynthesis C-methylase UbiE